MGRRSLKQEKKEHILDAYEACIERLGFRGATLIEVAKEAGMDRRLVLHNVGRRDDLITALVERILANYEDDAYGAQGQPEKGKELDFMLDYIFGEDFSNHPSSRLVAVLLSEVAFDPRIKEAIHTIYESFFNSVLSYLKIIVPSATEDAHRQVAYTVMTLSFGAGWMTTIGLPRDFKLKNKEVARQLILKLCD